MVVHHLIEFCLNSNVRRVGSAAAVITTLAAMAAPGVSAAADNSPNIILATVAVPTSPVWGTSIKPFAADAPWNSRPVTPKLGTLVVPPSRFAPAFEDGDFSTGVFLAKQSDGPVTVTGLPSSNGLYDADAETFHDVTIPHWPADVVPASGIDGHADIVDPDSGVIHSFLELRNVNGQWRAAQWAWTRLDGRGWGDPAHYFQGSRATGVAPAAGLIRKHEAIDGDAMYRHALSVSLASNGLSASPPYVFPATSADSDAAKTNTGSIPEGALVMLPYGFDIRQVAHPALRKVAQTLKTYGAYVVDRNEGVPFIIYAEKGSGLESLNAAVATDMEKIRLALRQVTSARGWLDGSNRAFTPETNLNLLSMRGTWQIQSGAAQGGYDSLAQAVLIPESATETVLVNFSNRGLTPLLWATPSAGTRHRLTAITTGGAKLRLQLYHPITNALLFDSGELENGEMTPFDWPVHNPKPVIFAISGIGQASSVSAELLRAN